MLISLNDDPPRGAARRNPLLDAAVVSRMSATLGRLTLMLGGEAMQSALSFALNLALLQTLPTREYGVFALVLVIGGIALTYIRALTAMPAAVLVGRDPGSSKARAYAVTFGSAALLLSGLIAAAVAAILYVWIEHDALAGALFVGLWSLRSHLRSVAFAEGRQRSVGLADLAYFLGGCASALPILFGNDVLRDVLLILAAANALGIGVIVGAMGVRPRLSLRASVRRRYGRFRAQVAWSIVSVTTQNLQGQGLAFMVAFIAGPAAYAPIAAALVMFVPLRLMGNALANMMQPDLSGRLGRGEVRSVWRSVLAWMGAMVLGSLAYGAAMLVVARYIPIAFPDSASPELLLALAWLLNLALLVSVMPRITLELFGAFRTITMITMGCAVLGLAVGYAAIAAGHPSLALAGGALSELAVLAVSLVVVGCLRKRLVEGRPYAALFQAKRQGR